MGKVFLVGAGPGDPDLLTIKALRLLQTANVVLHDGLVSEAILSLVRPQALLVDIGKRFGHKLLSQAEINSILVTHARTSACVVRLKGGDPSVFGRAGEEIDALLEAGIAFEIVPGITTALAAAAAARSSLTDRRFASSLVLVTAHRGIDSGAVEWDRLVTSGSTLAIYMPGSDYRALAAQLTHAGLDEQTPCAVVSRASLPDQQVLLTTIGRLGECNALPAPAHILVGRCLSAVEQVDVAAAALASVHADSAERLRD